MTERLDGQFPDTPGRVDVALAVALRDGRMLVRQRPAGSHLAGSWEFPGGKVERGESPEQAARRELEEEAGLAAERLDHLTIVVHDYADAPLRFHVFVARDPVPDEPPIDGAWSWKTLAELEALEMPEANAPMLRALRWRL
ncbi:MAG: (deoxy)nucleoside triphosphate pyrophosphohydrolase [bacterium]|nr:(deoxy)nucleoside triphosphate pyrophosphohydrolase [bacterium]